jgi:hypothetical protein
MAKKLVIPLAVVLACSLALAGGALAANGFAIPRSVIGGGGQPVTGSGYVLNGTVGEPIASNLTGGHTDPGLSSGFWWPPRYEVYLPLVVKD